MRRALPTLLLLGLVVPPSGARAATSVSSVAQDRWIEVRTTHLRLVSNASEGRVRPIAELLEAFRSFLSTSTKGLDLSSGAVDTVVVFKDDASFDPFKFAADAEGSQLMGFFSASPEANWIALNATPKQNIDNARLFRSFKSPYEIVLHEYTHAIVNRSFPGLPTWLNEGMAVYFGATWIDGKSAMVGRPTIEVLSALNGGLPVTLDRLAAVSSFHGLDAPSVTPAYGAAWATVHYMLVGSSERGKQFRKYLGDLASGASAGAPFAVAFGATPTALDTEVRAYVAKNQYAYLRYPLDALNVSVPVEAAPLTEEAMRVLLAELLVETKRTGRVQAGELIAPVLAKDPAHPGALGVRGLIEEMADKPADAERTYRAALSRTADDPVLRFRLGRVLVTREPVEADKLVAPPIASSPRLAEARTLLEGTLLDRPDLRGAYAYLGLTYLGEPLDHERGKVLLREAMKKQPDPHEPLALPLGAMCLWDGDRAAALELLKAPASDDLRWLILERDRLELNRLGENGGADVQKAWLRARIEATGDATVADQLRTWQTELEPTPAP